MIRRIKAAWHILTCEGFWLVYKKSNRRYRTFKNLTVDDLIVIMEDSTDALEQEITEQQVEANISAVKQLIK